ncbi:serine/threonine protein kinase [Massilia sp. P8910]|uniref:serine/threonine protein kinase n=1 Tax=Massilia antarctica TaxID=2765360 RepID=UPI001E5E8B4C|nr:serine/threonine protein kinase [Massilia antarctica]MCE3606927.1 serine/threonine protein kinase [Massilia antarctica]
MYPTFEKYNIAFAAHQKLLTDPELQKGVVSKSSLGTPLAISGGFALTYTIKAGAKKYAVRCFHRESKALERRYQAIERRLAQLHAPCFLHFEFQPKGIRIDGGTYPIVKMAWASGVTLGEFLEDNHRVPGALASLPASLLALSNFLEKSCIAHGDVQTGNVMVSGASCAVQLIDYDGMFVDEIRDLQNSEAGHVNFQHPERRPKNPFGPTMDRFSLIALSLALKALNEDVTLWGRSKSEMDAIVFRASDYADPLSSAVFSELMRKPSLAAHAQNFAAVCMSPLELTPSVEDFFAGRNIPATAKKIGATPSLPGHQSGYISVYDVLSAADYEKCLQRVGDKVEVIGRVVEISTRKPGTGAPYVFVNFGRWRGKIFKIAIWQEGIQALSDVPDDSWKGRWISVIGLMQAPYHNEEKKYTHLAVYVTANGQMTVISEAEAKFRLTPPAAKVVSPRLSEIEAVNQVKWKVTRLPPNPIPAARPASPAASAAPLGTKPSTNKQVLDNLRKAQKAPPPPPAAPSPAMPTPQPPRVPQPPQARPAPTVLQPVKPKLPPEPPRPSSLQRQSSYQRPKEKSMLGRIFDWLWK